MKVQSREVVLNVRRGCHHATLGQHRCALGSKVMHVTPQKRHLNNFYEKLTNAVQCYAQYTIKNNVYLKTQGANDEREFQKTREK